MVGCLHVARLYVVDRDVDELLARRDKGRWILDRVERAVRDGAGVILRARVKAKYEAFGGGEVRGGSVGGSRGGRTEEEELRERWTAVRSECSCYMLGVGDAGWKEICQEAKRKEIPEKLLKEVEANPELFDTAWRVGRLVGNEKNVVARFSAAAQPYFEGLWEECTWEERVQLHSLAIGGLANMRGTTALGGLVERGVLEWPDDGRGLIRVKSAAFREFVARDLDHEGLVAWQRADRGSAWSALWPPIAVGSLVVMGFLVRVNPEMVSTVLTAVVGSAAGGGGAMARWAEYGRDGLTGRDCWGIGVLRWQL